MNKRFKTIICVLLIMLICITPVFSKKKSVVTETKTTEDVTKVSSKKSAEEVVANVTIFEKSTDITKSDVTEAQASYKEAGYDYTEEEVLDTLINQILLNQFTVKLAESLTEDDINNLVVAYLANTASAYGYTISSNEEAEKFVEQLYGITIQQYANLVIKEYLIEAYISQAYESVFTTLSETLEDKVQEFYNENKDELKASEKVQIAHIFFAKQTDVDDATVEQKANDVYNRLKSGELTFDEAVEKYSEDSSNNKSQGVLGWVNKPETDFEKYLGQTSGDTDFISSTYHKALFTENTYNRLFKTPVGQFTEVLESVQGYHIIKVLTHNYAKNLTLDDNLYPNLDVTLRDYIANIYEQAAYDSAYADLMNKLTNEATITKK